jgi:DNA-directed RNA polymerase subunit M/transcription elongation factor TFIIS
MQTELDRPDHLDIRFYKSPYNVYRRAKLSMFSSVLNGHSQILKMNIVDRYTLIEKLERSSFNCAITKATNDNIPTKWENELFRDVYNVLCAKISANLSTTNSVKNDYLLPKILDESILISNLPKMSSQELFPDKYKDIMDKLETSKNVKQTVKTSAMYRCRRCGKNECTTENRYNRSLDEGVNLTITCMACGNEWNG